MQSRTKNALQERLGFAVAIDWERCPQGVDLVDIVPPPLSESATLIERARPSGWHFAQKSRTRDTVKIELSNFEDLVALRFVNTIRDDNLIGFLARFGMPIGWHEMSVEDVTSKREQMFNFLHDFIPGPGRHRAIARSLDVLNAFIGTFQLAPELGVSGKHRPVLKLRPRSLWQYMFMEAILAATFGANLHTCEECGSIFLTGPLTGRRGQARFCGDRCRVSKFRSRRE